MGITRPKFSGVIKVKNYTPPQNETECQILKGELAEDITEVGRRLGLEESEETPFSLVNEDGFLIMGKLLAENVYYLSGGKRKDTDLPSSEKLPDAAVIWAFDKRVLLHEPINHPSPETPYRLERALETLKASPHASLILPRELLSIPPHPENRAEYCEARLASLSEICLFHNLEKYKEFIEKGAVLENLKSDVYCNEKTSSDAARISAAACIDVGAKVLKNISAIRIGEELNGEKNLPASLGFCLVRPPGHHCSSQTPSGFCLVNNVAVASAVLLKDKFVLEKKGNPRKPRIAILDLDVHFGEGTASFVDSYAPGESPPFPPLYLSIHRFDSGNFYPFLPEGSAENIGKNGVSICNVGVNTNAHIPSKCHEVISDFLLEKVLLKIFFPRLKEFKPDLLFVSLGFDAAYGDPLGKMAVEGGFARSMMLLKVWCRGPSSIPSQTPVSPVPVGLVCVLEGGYNPESVSCGLTSVSHILTFPSDDAETMKFTEHCVPKTWGDLRQRINRREQEHREEQEDNKGKSGNAKQTVVEDEELLSRHMAWCDSVIKSTKEIHLSSIRRKCSELK